MADIKTLIKDQAGRKFEDMIGQTVSSIRFDPQRSLQSFAHRISARVDPEPSPYVEAPRPRVVITTAGFPESTAIPTEPQTPQNYDAGFGASGAPGPAGPAPTLTASGFSVTGSTPTVSIVATGATGNYKLRIGVPSGGPPGPTGPTGPPGPPPVGLTISVDIVTSGGTRNFVFTNGSLVNLV